MNVFKNQSIEQAFLEKEFKFDLSSGIKIDYRSNTEFKCYGCVASGLFIPLREELPPLDLTISSVIFEFSESAYIDYVNIEESPDTKILWNSSSVSLEPKTNDLSASISIPENYIDIPYEIEVLEPSGIKYIISKSNHLFKITNKSIDCYSLNRTLTYRMRMRLKILNKCSEWSNWLSFKPRRRRSLGSV